MRITFIASLPDGRTILGIGRPDDFRQTSTVMRPAKASKITKKKARKTKARAK